jgi:hypothetical protein
MISRTLCHVHAQICINMSIDWIVIVRVPEHLLVSAAPMAEIDTFRLPRGSIGQ